MSYLGRSAKLSLKAQEKVSFLATAGQTSKTGLSYTPSFVEVYVNGVLLTDNSDYTATNGNSITFTVALLLNDEVTVISLKTFTVADHYSKTEADTLLAAKAPIASPVFTGTTTTNLLASNGTILGLQANGTSVGSIGTSGGATYFGSADSGIMFNGVNQNPTNGTSTRVDNTNDLGAASYRYKDIYLGGGAFLGGTATANKLDDYEEGTWTGAASGVTATVQNTKYTKIGRLVYVTGHIICTANATADVSISGLPFAIAGSENGIGTAMNYNVNIAGGSTYNFVTYVQGSSIRFYRSEDNSPWLWAGSGTLNNGSQILFNVTYQAA